MAQILFDAGVFASNQKYIEEYPDDDTVVFTLHFFDNTRRGNGFQIKYTRSTLTWSDLGGDIPYFFGLTDQCDYTTTSLYNPSVVHGFKSNGDLAFQFDSTYWQNTTTNSDTGTEGNNNVINPTCDCPLDNPPPIIPRIRRGNLNFW